MGYMWAALRRVDRPITPELMQFHRGEQMKKLRLIARSLIRFRKIDSFTVSTHPHCDRETSSR